jgi:Catalytic LigB subunit of aromatic ring-opening dioxygenase
MAQIVGGVGLSHSSFMVSNPGQADEDQASRAFAAYARASAYVQRLAPDALVVFGTDHFNSFFLDNLPQFCIGVGDRYDGCEDNMPPMAVPGAEQLANDVLTGLLERGFDPALSQDLNLDHSFFSPLHFLTPALDVPVVPIVTNAITGPFPPPRRSFEFGAAVRETLRGSTACGRVVVVGSGGLSHWPGTTEHGRINEEFDRIFLQHFAAADLPWLTQLSTADLLHHAGNGGQELRNWLALRGCLPTEEVTVEFYEPIPGWLGGWAVATIAGQDVESSTAVSASAALHASSVSHD